MKRIRRLPATDAQRLKRSLLKAARLIGKRKRIRPGEFFELVLGCAN